MVVLSLFGDTDEILTDFQTENPDLFEKPENEKVKENNEVIIEESYQLVPYEDNKKRVNKIVQERKSHV